jgi:hypothetical protein
MAGAYAALAPVAEREVFVAARVSLAPRAGQGDRLFEWLGHRLIAS